MWKTLVNTLSTLSTHIKCPLKGYFNPIALRIAKIPLTSGQSESNRVNQNLQFGPESQMSTNYTQKELA